MRAKVTLGLLTSTVTLATALACSSDDSGSNASGGRPTAAGDAGHNSENGGGSGEAATEGGTLGSAGGAAGHGETAGGSGSTETAGAGGQPDCDGSLLILLDRSKSMSDAELTPGVNRWQAVQAAFSSVIDDLPTAQPWALRFFPDGEGPECAAPSDDMAVSFAGDSSSAVRASVLNAEATGNGTPLPTAYEAALKYANSLPQQPKNILIIGDGIPNCSLTGASEFEVAQADAVQLTTDAAKRGMRTFVIGVGADSFTDSAALNELASAGGTARLSNPLSPEFYAAADEAQVQAALARVVDRVTHCNVEPDIEHPGYHALPFATDFETGTLEDFRLGTDDFQDVSPSWGRIVVQGSNHALSVESSGDATLAVAGGHDWTDTMLHAKLRLVGDAQATIQLRFDPQAKSSVMLDIGAGLFRVRHRDGSTVSLITPSPKPAIVADTWYEVTFSVVGDQVSVSLDGVEQGKATLTGSGHGGMALGSLSGTVEYDDISAIAP